MFPIPVFAGWRLSWNQDETTKDLANVADSLALRRNQIRSGSTEVRDLRMLAPRLREFRLLRQERAQQLKQENPLLLYRSYISGIAEFKAIIDAARWGRWLLLEEALADGMQYGDLPLGAMILRTQIEDLGFLLCLEKIEREVSAKSSVSYSDVEVVEGAELATMEENVDFLWDRFLPRFERATPAEMGARKQNDPVVQRPDELAESFAALNDYVHPNYGSHIATIFPETSTSGRILLAAFKGVYEVFFKLDFLQRSPVRPAHSDFDKPVSYVSALRRFVERTLPRLDRTLQKSRGYSKEWTGQQPTIFRDRLNMETDRHRITADGLLELGNDPEQELKLKEMGSTLRSLCTSIEPGRELSMDEVLRFTETHTTPIVAFNTTMWVMLANLRELAQSLESESKKLSIDVLFPRQPPFDRWISFARDAIQLAVLSTHHKMDMMWFAAIRMMNRKNSLGAILCARSLLEHYAVARELGKRFKTGVESIEQKARSGKDVIAQFDRLEQDIGRFLVGTKATSEFETRWKERWNQLGITNHLNLARDVEHTFPDGDVRGFLYAYFSRCAHGDLLTGAELLRPGSEVAVDVNLAKVVMVLAESATIDWMLDYWSPVASAMLRLTRPTGVSAATSIEDLNLALRKGTTVDQCLKLGRDVFGQGTEADPYRFREDLQYHEVFYQFCREQAIDLTHWKRSHWLSGGKHGDCLTAPNGKHLYFRVIQDQDPLSR